MIRFFDDGRTHPAPAPRPSTLTIAGMPVRCNHCGGSGFDVTYRVLGAASPLLFRHGRAAQEATAFTCRNCGHITWFAGRRA